MKISERDTGIFALVISLIGIALLFFLTYYNTPKVVPISSIQFQEKDSTVSFSGTVDSIKINSGSASIRVCDGDDCVTVLAFSSQYSPYLFEKGQVLFVVGKVDEYNGVKTVSASRITIVEQ